MFQGTFFGTCSHFVLLRGEIEILIIFMGRARGEGIFSESTTRPIFTVHSKVHPPLSPFPPFLAGGRRRMGCGRRRRGGRVTYILFHGWARFYIGRYIVPTYLLRVGFHPAPSIEGGNVSQGNTSYEKIPRAPILRILQYPLSLHSHTALYSGLFM